MNELMLTVTPELGLSTTFESMFLSLLLGLLVAGVYRYSVGARLSTAAMSGSLVLLSMLGAMIMMVIGNNIARAFSLVGALAIVRFRTRLRSPWDITFIFFSLAVGIAAGVGAYQIAVLGAMIIALSIMAMTPMLTRRSAVHTLRCDLAAYEDAATRIEDLMAPYLQNRWLEEVRSLRFGETFSYRYRIVLRNDAQIAPLLRILAESEGVERVVISSEDAAEGIED